MTFGFEYRLALETNMASGPGRYRRRNAYQQFQSRPASSQVPSDADQRRNAHPQFATQPT